MKTKIKKNFDFKGFFISRYSYFNGYSEKLDVYNSKVETIIKTIENDFETTFNLDFYPLDNVIGGVIKVQINDKTLTLGFEIIDSTKNSKDNSLTKTNKVVISYFSERFNLKPIAYTAEYSYYKIDNFVLKIWNYLKDY